ncbi:MAG: phage portal protein, partial [Alphaproteobacteria bacterium]
AGHGRESAFLAVPAARWSGRGYEALVRAGFEQNPVVQRSVRIIAESAATVRWVVARDGVKLEAHPLIELLRRPNPQQGGPELIEAAMAFLALAGNTFIERVDGADGTPAELYVLRPERMRIVPGAAGWPARYEYRVGARRHDFTVDPLSGRSPILHLRAFHPLDDHYGLGALQAAARGIDLHNAVDGWNKALIDNAARPSGALVFEPRDGQASALSEEQFARLKSEMEESFQGARNAGRPLLLEGGLKWQQMAFSPADMNHGETKHGAARDIALAFGVPPMLLGIPGDNTYSNYQEANRALWRLTLLPLLCKLSAALNTWLVPAYATPGLGLDFDRDAIPALAFERERQWSQVNNASFLSDSEKRALLGLPARPPAAGLEDR